MFSSTLMLFKKYYVKFLEEFRWTKLRYVCCIISIIHIKDILTYIHTHTHTTGIFFVADVSGLWTDQISCAHKNWRELKSRMSFPWCVTGSCVLLFDFLIKAPLCECVCVIQAVIGAMDACRCWWEVGKGGGQGGGGGGGGPASEGKHWSLWRHWSIKKAGKGQWCTSGLFLWWQPQIVHADMP